MVHFDRIRSSFRGYAETYRAATPNFSDLFLLINVIKPLITVLLDTSLNLRLKIIICVHITFIKEIPPEIVRQVFYFCSNAEIILSRFQIESALDNAFQKIITSVDQFVRNGSGWVIESINFVDLHKGRYQGRVGGCTGARIPYALKKKRCLLNIKTKNNLCFLYAILASLYPAKKNSNAPSAYSKYLKVLNTKSFSFPFDIDDIPRFENLNKLKINVFGYSGDVFPIYLSKCSFEKEIFLLYYKKHYFCIKNFNSLLSRNRGTRFFCKRCFTGFQRKSGLTQHIKLCRTNAEQKARMPVKGSNVLKFNSIHKSVFHPYIAFADFESITEKISSAVNNPTTSFTLPVEHHTPICYSILILDFNDRIVFHDYYAGVDVISRFLRVLKQAANIVMEKIKINYPINGSCLDKKHCHICGKPFNKTDKIVLDHMHQVRYSNIRGPAHAQCNLQYRNSLFLPVFFHNLRNYDSHLIIKKLTSAETSSLNIIPVNSEKFTTFTLGNIRFLDSFLFLDASLSTLIENLEKSGHSFPIFNKFYEAEENRSLLRRKNIFPYSYFSTKDILKEKTLPPQEKFFNYLTQSHISTEDYQHALHVYNAFGCNTFADYLKIYTDVDTLMLAEVVTSFRRMSMTNYGLDPAFFVTAPQLTWEAGLKFCRAELELLTDINKYIFLESQMRGGVCLLGKRFAQANNPYLGDNYDFSKPLSYILALDATNLYGFAMCKPLPTGQFVWLKDTEFETFNLNDKNENDPVGYILEVDLSYPDHLHESHNDFPLAPEHLNITKEMLSPYQKEVIEKLNIFLPSQNKKLVPNFFPKSHYVLHYLNLKYYVKKGMVIKKIHNILAFAQEPWLKPYIEFNNLKRQEAISIFEKNFFKKMNNAFFGKTCQNVRKKVDVKAALTPEKCSKYMSSPLLNRFDCINESLVLFNLKKKSLYLDKPIFIGFCILDIAKLRMYQLYYDYFKKYYKTNCELLYTDTDSLYLHIRTTDAYEDQKKNFFREILDLSNFHPQHFCFDSANAGQLGILKNETCIPIQSFVGLRCKMYCFQYGSHLKKTAKGVSGNCLKQYDFNSFKNVLFGEKILRSEQHFIKSKKHVVNTVLQNKVSLSTFYDKKYLLPDKINSNSFGHYLNNNV